MKRLDAAPESPPTTLCDWDDVDARLVLVDRPGRRIFGVTPGAKMAAAWLRKAEHVRLAEGATHLLADVQEYTGQFAETEQAHPGKPLLVLFDSTGCDRDRGRLIMPWESAPVRSPDPAATGLRPEEWQAIERLAQCHSLMSELEGLDFDRFDGGLQALEEMILALPAKRGLAGGPGGA